MLLGSFTSWQGLLEVTSTWKLWICTSYPKAWFSQYTFIKYGICKPIQNAHVSGLYINSEYLLHHVKWNFLHLRARFLSNHWFGQMYWKITVIHILVAVKKVGGGGIRNLNRNSCKTVKVRSRQQFSSMAGAACALSWCSPVLPRQLQEPSAAQWWRICPLRRYCLF